MQPPAHGCNRSVHLHVRGYLLIFHPIFQSRRDCVSQPRVAESARLPSGTAHGNSSTRNGLCQPATPPANKISILGATLSLDERSPVKTLQRTEPIHEHFENRMRIADAEANVFAFENPKDVLNQRPLVSRLNSYLIKLVEPQRHRLAKGPFERKNIARQPEIRA